MHIIFHITGLIKIIPRIVHYLGKIVLVSSGVVGEGSGLWVLRGNEPANLRCPGWHPAWGGSGSGKGRR